MSIQNKEAKIKEIQTRKVRILSGETLSEIAQLTIEARILSGTVESVVHSYMDFNRIENPNSISAGRTLDVPTRISCPKNNRYVNESKCNELRSNGYYKLKGSETVEDVLSVFMAYRGCSDKELFTCALLHENRTEKLSNIGSGGQLKVPSTIAMPKEKQYVASFLDKTVNRSRANIPSSFWQNETNNYRSDGTLFFEVQRGNTLSEIAQDVKSARGLSTSLSTLVEAIAKENNIQKIGNDYLIIEKQTINIGVFRNYLHSYILYVDVTNDVKSKISSWKSSMSGTTIEQFFDNLKMNGKWDIINALQLRSYNSKKFICLGQLMIREEIHAVVCGAMEKYFIEKCSANIRSSYIFHYHYNSMNQFEKTLADVLTQLEMKHMMSPKEAEIILEGLLGIRSAIADGKNAYEVFNTAMTIAAFFAAFETGGTSVLSREALRKLIADALEEVNKQGWTEAIVKEILFNLFKNLKLSEDEAKLFAEICAKLMLKNKAVLTDDDIKEFYLELAKHYLGKIKASQKSYANKINQSLSSDPYNLGKKL